MKSLDIALKITEKFKDSKAEANLYRIKGCVHLINKDYEEAIAAFQESMDLFKEAGVSLGIAICEAAIGHIKYLLSISSSDSKD